MADRAAVDATNRGFAALTAFLRQDNARDSQERRTSTKMIQSGDTRITMWVRRTAVAIENVERMFKAYLTDAEVRQNKLEEILLEMSRGRGSGSGGGGPGGDQAADDPKFDWSSLKKSWLKGAILAFGAGLASWINDIFRSDDWVKEMGLEPGAGWIGKLFFGSKDGGWLNALKGASKGAVVGGAIGLKIGGLPGMLAGGILGAILMGISHYIGAEAVTKMIDKVFKGVARIFGLETATTEKTVQAAETEYELHKTKTKKLRDALKKAQDKLAAVEKEHGEGSKEHHEQRVKVLRLQKTLREYSEKEADLYGEQQRLKLDLITNEESRLKSEKSDIEGKNIQDKLRAHQMRYQADTVYKNDKEKQAILRAEADLLDYDIEQRNKRLKELEPLIKKASARADAAEEAYQADEKIKTSDKLITGTNRALDKTGEAIGSVLDDLLSIFRGKDMQALYKDYKEFKEKLAKNREIVEFAEERLAKSRAKWEVVVDKKIASERKKAEEDLKEAEKDHGKGSAEFKKALKDVEKWESARTKEILMGRRSEAIKADPELARMQDLMGNSNRLGLQGAERELDRAKKQVDEKRQMDLMFLQYQKSLEDQGKEPVTREEFIKLFRENEATIDKEKLVGVQMMKAKAPLSEEQKRILAEESRMQQGQGPTNIISHGGDTYNTDASVKKSGDASGGGGPMAWALPVYSSAKDYNIPW